ncbi:MAG TPA: hypothetical protein VI893_09305, partial [Thermoplasmata archaeon]|nr:hypothetical protein [Thermoplasmata archaeon]
MRAGALAFILFVSLLVSSGLGAQPSTGRTSEGEPTVPFVTTAPVSRIPADLTPYGDGPATAVTMHEPIPPAPFLSSNETLIAGTATDESRPSLLMDRAGRLHAAYDYVNGSTDHDIGYAISDDGGKTWKNS